MMRPAHIVLLCCLHLLCCSTGFVQLPTSPAKRHPHAAVSLPPHPRDATRLFLVSEAVAAPHLLLSLDSEIQSLRDGVQATIASAVSSLPLQITLAVLSAAASGALLAPFRKAIDAGKETESRYPLNTLAACAALDLLGDASSFIPGGEVTDPLWAPISTLALFYIFHSPVLAGINCVKELLPFFDILPIATMGWLLRYVYPESDLATAIFEEQEEKEDGQ